MADFLNFQQLPGSLSPCLIAATALRFVLTPRPLPRAHWAGAGVAATAVKGSSGLAVVSPVRTDSPPASFSRLSAGEGFRVLSTALLRESASVLFDLSDFESWLTFAESEKSEPGPRAPRRVTEPADLRSKALQRCSQSVSQCVTHRAHSSFLACRCLCLDGDVSLPNYFYPGGPE